MDKLYGIGEVVPVSGNYICVPCGYIQRFEAGELFITCEACFAGTEIGPEDYQEKDSEFWEFFS
jgi:hypothetical protein